MSDLNSPHMRRMTGVGLALMVIGTSASAGNGPPAECDDLSAIAPFTQFRYEQFQNIFNTSCTSCHPGNVGAGNLGLGDGFSYGALVGVPSDGLPSILRVAPGDPLQSMLFLKINCDDPPGLGIRMPLGGSNLSATQQAFFFDWIGAGAPLSRLGFEDR